MGRVNNMQARFLPVPILAVGYFQEKVLLLWPQKKATWDHPNSTEKNNINNQISYIARRTSKFKKFQKMGNKIAVKFLLEDSEVLRFVLFRDNIKGYIHCLKMNHIFFL